MDLPKSESECDVTGKPESGIKNNTNYLGYIISIYCRRTYYQNY